MSVETMSDGELVARLAELLREERRLTAAVLVHLGEVEARRLFLPAACSSMHIYCTRVLRMSEHQAFKRIRAARAVRRYPVVGQAVAEGRLHLSGVVLLAPQLTADNAEALVAEASGKSKAEIAVLLARRAPRPDVPERLEPVAEQVPLAPGLAGLVAPGPPGQAVASAPADQQVAPGPADQQVAPGPADQQVAPEPADRQVAPGLPGPEVQAVAPGPASQAVAPGQAQQVAAKVMPLAPARFALQVTIGEATRGKLLRAHALLRHQLPSGDLAEVLDRALDALISKVEARKFGAVKKPRAAAKASQSKRYLSREVRRQVAARDGARCSFVAEDGRRCEETGFLELDHLVPVARGGGARPSAEGVRLLCRAHNRYEAERILGREVVRAGQRAALSARGPSAPAGTPGRSRANDGRSLAGGIRVHATPVRGSPK